jgi:hypothetical protein
MRPREETVWGCSWCPSVWHSGWRSLWEGWGRWPSVSTPWCAGGRDQSGGGLGGFSERDIHAIAGLRMVAGGVVSLVFGALLLWSYFSG